MISVWRGRLGAGRARATAVLVLAGLGSLVAACGGGPASAVANLGHNTTTSSDISATVTSLPPGQSTQKHFEQALKFSECMRSHGIGNFPDPGSTGGIEISSSSGIDPASGQFQAAQKACQKYAPPRPTHAQQEQMEQQALAFSACMRAHGLPDFPDPTFGPQGQISRGSSSSDDNPASSPFQAAVKHCNP